VGVQWVMDECNHMGCTRQMIGAQWFDMSPMPATLKKKKRLKDIGTSIRSRCLSSFGQVVRMNHSACDFLQKCLEVHTGHPACKL